MRKANKLTRVASGSDSLESFHPTTPRKLKIRQATCCERCLQVDERRIVLEPTMTAADPGAEISQKGDNQRLFAGWGSLLGSKK
jgi:hypothetical protein